MTESWQKITEAYRHGRLRDVIREVDAALVRNPVSTTERERLYAYGAEANVIIERFTRATEMARAAVNSADPTAQGLACCAISTVRLVEGKLGEALHLAQRSIEQLGRPTAIPVAPLAGPYTVKAYCLRQMGRYDEAEQVLRAAEVANAKVDGPHQSALHSERAALLFYLGAWDAAQDEAVKGAQGVDPIGDRIGMTGISLLIAIHRGQRTNESGLPFATATLRREYAYLPWAQAISREAAGQYLEAVDYMAPTWGQARGFASPPLIYPTAPDFARMLIIGDAPRSVLAYLVETLDVLAATAGSIPAIEGALAFCRGMLADDDDLVQLKRAMNLYRQARQPLYEAYADEEISCRLAARNSRTEAKAALTAAVGLYKTLGAAWDISRTLARARAVGVHQGVTGPRLRPRRGWGALTAAERRVARLVAQGHTNREVGELLGVSPRTVQTHVSHILTKLGAGRRADIAAEAGRHPEED